MIKHSEFLLQIFTLILSGYIVYPTHYLFPWQTSTAFPLFPLDGTQHLSILSQRFHFNAYLSLHMYTQTYMYLLYHIMSLLLTKANLVKKTDLD